MSLQQVNPAVTQQYLTVTSIRRKHTFVQILIVKLKVKGNLDSWKII